MARKRDQAKFEYRRKSVLRAAETCFREHGFHSTGMAEICKAAGMSPGALYRYFPSKDAIIEAIAEEERQDIAELLDALAVGRSIAETISAVLEEVVVAVSGEDYGRLALEIAAEAARNPKVAEPFSRNTADLRAGFVAVIAHGIEQGEIDPDLDPAAVAELLMIVIDGATGRQSLDPDFDGRAFARDIARMIRRLLSPR